VHLTVVKCNEGAQKIYEGLGFSQYGLEEKALKVDGKYYDEIMMVKFLN